MTTAASAPAAAGSARSPWFVSARFDVPLILLVPLFTWPLVMAGERAWGAAVLNRCILLTATGHYFATFARAYGDRDLFARFRTRFLLLPALLLVTSVGMFLADAGAPLLLATSLWAFWHWLAQAFGFARIYDSKVGSFRPLTAWLDKALVITCFVGAVVGNDGALVEFGKPFLKAGIGLPSAAQFGWVRTCVLAAMAVVGATYLIHLVWTIARRQPWSWQKQVMHATTIGYYWFAFGWLPNVLVAYVLYELFHDIQYYAITWLTCRKRVQRPGTTAWLTRMFRPGWPAAGAFVLTMAAFGAIDIGGRTLVPEEPIGKVLLGVFLTAAVLHYYYDGFIWKAREQSLGVDLGIASGLRARVVPGLRHAAWWMLFFGPVFGLLLLHRAPPGDRERLTALVAFAPGDFLSQTDLGLDLAKSGDLPAALEHYRASIAANPGLAQSHANYGAALDFVGELDAAREQYEQTLRCPDHGGAHAQAHTNLGVLLLVRGDRAGAAEHFQNAQRLGGENPIGRMFGLAAGIPATATERRMQLYTAILALEPRQPDAHLQLGNLMLADHRYADAEEHFSALLTAAPGHVPALLGLAEAQAGQGEIDPALATVQRILQIKPDQPEAIALRQRLGGH